jgi:alpha-glucosidase (family GH31 glycosyl hydrolase)
MVVARKKIAPVHHRRHIRLLIYPILSSPKYSDHACHHSCIAQDIGGFSGGVVDDDWHTESPELFLRWLQFGALSPIMRTHCRYCDQRVWTWTKYNTPDTDWFTLMSATMLLRNRLVPYIYTHAALKTHRLGESLLLPMYWDEQAAALPESYDPKWQQQYFFGSELLAAPISSMVNSSAANTTARNVWLPPSATGWFDFVTMTAVSGGDTGVLTAKYGLGDIPLFVRGGAVLPTRDMQSAYLAVADPLIWLVVPGATSGNGTVYEDDGDSMDYREARYQVTNLAYVTTAAETTVSVVPEPGTVSFAAAPTCRDQWVAFQGVTKLPSSATCDGLVLHVRSPGASPGFWLDMSSGGNLVVACGNATTFAGAHTIVVST